MGSGERGDGRREREGLEGGVWRERRWEERERGARGWGQEREAMGGERERG